jgi:hypothetical protein
VYYTGNQTNSVDLIMQVVFRPRNQRLLLPISPLLVVTTADCIPTARLRLKNYISQGKLVVISFPDDVAKV